MAGELHRLRQVRRKTTDPVGEVRVARQDAGLWQSRPSRLSRRRPRQEPEGDEAVTEAVPLCHPPPQTFTLTALLRQDHLFSLRERDCEGYLQAMSLGVPEVFLQRVDGRP